MDRDPGILFYQIAYRLVSWLLYIAVLFGAVVGGYYAWFYAGQIGAISYVAGIGILRLVHDIRLINRGEFEPPREWLDRAERDRRDEPGKNHPFKKSGR